MDRKSTSGYCIFVWGNLVTWKSKKQAAVARSSDEAEFRAMDQGICERLVDSQSSKGTEDSSGAPIEAIL